MKALTVWQPHAWAIVSGRKRVENRSWATRHRGPVLIHAGKNASAFETEEERERGILLPDGSRSPGIEELSFGAIVGVATLVDCLPLRRYAGRRTDPFASGPVCWLLEDAVAFAEPVPCPGSTLLWDVPSRVLRALERSGYF